MFKNNLYVLKFVFKFCPLLVIFAILNIASSVLLAVLKVQLIKETIELVMAGEEISILYKSVGLYLVLVLVTSFFKMFYTNYINPRYRIIFMKKMQHFLFSKVKNVDMEMFDNPEFYDNYSRALREGTWMGMTVFNNIVRFLTSFLIVIALGVIIASDFILISIIVLSAIVNILAVNAINKSWYIWSKQTESERRMYNYVNRTFYRQRFAGEIKTTNISNLLTTKYLESAEVINKKYANTHKKVVWLHALHNLVKGLIERGLVYIYLAYQLFKGYITISIFTSSLNATFQFSSNFIDAINILTTLKENSLYIDDFIWLVNYKGKLEGRKGLEIDKFEELNIDSINFKYENTDNFSIEDLSLRIKKGEKIALVGLNGSGKTTLTKLILNFYLPSEGYLFVDGNKYDSIDQKSLRNRYSVVFQDFQIYALSIGENILMRKIQSNEDEQKVWDALEMVGMKEKILKLDEGIYTQVTREFNRNGAVFSGGEVQRIAIARVFASDADMYILDEPTSALDPFSEERINKLIIQNTKKAMIIIAHRLSTVIDCDVIYLMDKGKIIEKGTHEEMMKKNGLYSKMFNTQKNLYAK